MCTVNWTGVEDNYLGFVPSVYLFSTLYLPKKVEVVKFQIYKNSLKRPYIVM